MNINAESTYEWQNSLFMLSDALFYFLQAIWCPEHANPLRMINDVSNSAIVHKDGHF